MPCLAFCCRWCALGLETNGLSNSAHDAEFRTNAAAENDLSSASTEKQQAEMRLKHAQGVVRSRAVQPKQ